MLQREEMVVSGEPQPTCPTTYPPRALYGLTPQALRAIRDGPPWAKEPLGAQCLATRVEGLALVLICG